MNKEGVSAILVWSLALALDHAWACAWEPGLRRAYGDQDDIRALPIYGEDYPRAVWTPEGREALRRFTEHLWGDGEMEGVIPILSPEIEGDTWRAKAPWGAVEVRRDGAVDLWVAGKTGTRISISGPFAPACVSPAPELSDPSRSDAAPEIADCLCQALSNLTWCLASPEVCGEAVLAANILSNLWGAVVHVLEK
ncbi:hypothetical protein MN1_680 [Thermus phage MN1]|nr:hypothetical protein MN1_680 [Thermus phage MN1]